jgi:hypothetical protein
MTEPINVPVMLLPDDACIDCPHIKKLSEKQRIYALKLLTMTDLIDTIITGQQRIETVLDVMNKDLQELKRKIETLHKDNK